MNILINKYQEGITKGVDASVFGKNTDDLLLKVIGVAKQEQYNKVSKETLWFLGANIQFCNYTKLLLNQDVNGVIENLGSKLNNMIIPEDFNLNLITATRRIASELSNIFGLTEGVDYKLLGEPLWSYPEFNFRVTIPDKMLKVPVYANLVSKVLELGVPVKEMGDLNVIYFAQIGETEQFIYEDENILVEEK